MRHRDVYVKCLFFMLTLSLFLLYGTNVSLPFVGFNSVVPIFGFSTVPDCVHVRVCGFLCFCVLVRVP